MPIKQITKIGMFIAVGMILSYIEVILPFTPMVPGIKIGLSNIIVVYLLYTEDLKYCMIYQFCRIVLMGLLFGNYFSLLYSLSGAITSLIVMIIIFKTYVLDIIGCSMIGGIIHNVTQVLVASLFVKRLEVFYYLPVLIIAGIIAGFIVGKLSKTLMKWRLS